MISQDEEPNPTRAQRVAVIIAVLFIFVGAGLRVHQAANPYERMSADEGAYTSVASELSRSGRYRQTNGDEAWHWAPGTPAFFAAAHRVAGTLDDSADEVSMAAAVHAAQTFIGVLTIILAALLAFRLAGTTAAAAVTAAIVALYPPLIIFTGEGVSEPLAATVVTAAALAGAWSLQRRSGASWLLSGTLLGLAILVRANLMLLAGVCAVALFASQLRISRRTAAISTALFCLGFLAVVAPWVTFASLQNQKFTPVTTASPASLFIGTFVPGEGTTSGVKRELASEVQARFPEMRGRHPNDIPGGYVTATVAMRHSELGRESALLLASWHNVSDHAAERPHAFAGMLLKKVWRLWSQPATGGAIEPSLAVRVAHLLLTATALAGLGLGVYRTRHGTLAIVLAALLSHSVLHAVMVSEPRYALPMLPTLFAAGMASWWIVINERRNCG